ncbi:MAG TPA: PadR family transcriptional regulator [Solirubrobacteraceae bacterium]|jgi:DNA-binding PadR family transcriptional regulator|nr:PadR family transcriptional regulator [Solirubrobacteraceae bacterium]
MKAGKASGDQAEKHDTTPMRSPVNWALLGLVIERPSYAYDLAQRFERRYEEVLPLSNIGHIYTALGVLAGRSLVEEIPGTRAGRQPKPHYCATPLGTLEYRDWLIGQVGEDRRRNQLFVLALGALTNEPEHLREVMTGYERACLSEGMHTPISGAPETASDSASALLGRLGEEENRLAVGAKLEWVEYARQELKKLDGRRRG